MSEGAWDQDADTLSLPRTQESLAEFSWGDCASFGTRLEEAAVLRGYGAILAQCVQPCETGEVERDFLASTFAGKSHGEPRSCSVFTLPPFLPGCCRCVNLPPRTSG